MQKRRLWRWLGAATVALVAGGVAVAVWTRVDPELPDRFWVKDRDDALYDGPDGDALRTAWRTGLTVDDGRITVSKEAEKPRTWPLTWFDALLPAPAPAMPTPATVNNWRSVQLPPGTAFTGNGRPIGIGWLRFRLTSWATPVRVDERPSGRWRECVRSLSVLAPGEHRPPDLVGEWCHPTHSFDTGHVEVILRADGAFLLGDGTPAGLWAAVGDVLYVETSQENDLTLADGSFRLSADRRHYESGAWKGRRPE